MKVSIVVVNYKNAAVTLGCLHSIQKLRENFDGQVVACVVDNDSGEAELEKISGSLREHDILLKAGWNRGYFAALNLGIQRCGKSDFVIVGNNDIEFAENFLVELKKLSLSRNTLVVAPSIERLDGAQQNPHCIGRISWLRRFLYDIYYFSYFFALVLRFLAVFIPARQQREAGKAAGAMRIRMGYGACYVLPKAYFECCGLLPETVFLMGEEAVLANQVQEAGGETWFFPQLKVIHREHATFSSVPSRTTYEFSRQSHRKIRDFL